MKSFNDIIDDVFIKEGDVYSEPPLNDQPTGRGGITLKAYQRFCDAMQPNRHVTKLDLQALAHEEARAVVRWLLNELHREMGLGAVTFDPLRLQLLDFGYNSGGERAIRWLQRVIHVPRTGLMDIATVRQIGGMEQYLIHQALIAARLQMIDSWTDAPANKKYEEGLENRALSFSLLKVP